MKITALILSILMAAALFPFRSPYGYAAEPSGCVTCHTNEAQLKALCKIPAIPSGEGEG
jgi:hypothetical protein